MAGPAPMSGRAVEVARRQPDGSWLYVIDDPFTLGPIAASRECRHGG